MCLSQSYYDIWSFEINAQVLHKFLMSEKHT